MRELTEAAKCAKAIREELKKEFPLTKFKVKSSNFSMGDSVDINWENGPTDSQVKEFTDKYQYGHFDGMQDMYENSNRRADIHQSKYVMTQRNLSDDVKNILTSEIQSKILDNFNGEMPPYEQDRLFGGIASKHAINGKIKGLKRTDQNAGSWHELYTIEFEDTTETITEEIEIKGDFEIVNYSEKAVALFGDTRPIKEALKALNGRFNPNLKYNDGKKAGWIFSKKYQSQVESLISNSIKTSEISKVIETNLSDLLRDKAEKTQAQADKIDASVKGNWTHRRAMQADSMKLRKESTERTANILFALSDAWAKGTIEDKFKFIKSRSDVEFMTMHGYFPTPPPKNAGWYADEYPKVKEKVIELWKIKSESEFKQLRSELKDLGTTEKTDEQIKAEKIQGLEDSLRGAIIPGFFPTPDKLIDSLIEAANIQKNEVVLEPSAGLGNIAEKVRDLNLDNQIYCIEVQYTLKEILEAKGFDVIHDDFMQYSNGRSYDKIIMNPPFENNQDIEHLMQAYSLLNAGGRVVCVMADNKESKDNFNLWLEEVGGYYEPNPENSFTGPEAFRSTGINTITVVIDK